MHFQPKKRQNVSPNNLHLSMSGGVGGCGEEEDKNAFFRQSHIKSTLSTEMVLKFAQLFGTFMSK